MWSLIYCGIEEPFLVLKQGIYRGYIDVYATNRKMGLMQRIADIKQQLSTIPDPEIPVITIDELGASRC